MSPTLLCRLGVVAWLVLYALPAGAGWEAANAAYGKSDFVTAMKELRPLAERDDVNAQYNVGVMYGQGDGVERNDPEARKWFRKAAQQEHVGAQMNLDIIYSRDGGVPRNDAMAATWCRKAAERGFPDAQVQLGIINGVGRGVPRDFVEAYLWLELAAVQGVASAVQKNEVLSLAMTDAEVVNAEARVRDWVSCGQARKNRPCP